MEAKTDTRLLNLPAMKPEKNILRRSIGLDL